MARRLYRHLKTRDSYNLYAYLTIGYSVWALVDFLEWVL